MGSPYFIVEKRCGDMAVDKNRGAKSNNDAAWFLTTIQGMTNLPAMC